MSTQVRTSNQSRASTKIVIGFVLLLVVGYFAKYFLDKRALEGFNPAPLSPGVVNLVGVDTQKGGYHIVVANTLAQLIRSPVGSFQSEDSGSDQVPNEGSDSEKKRVPLKELILTLKGDPKNVDDIGRYVAVLNDMKEEDLRAKAVIWKKADIDKALSGDAKLKDKLEKDLNTKLDGTPLAEFRPSTFDTGITIVLPVTMNVSTPSGQKPVTGNVMIPFQTTLMRALLNRVGTEQIDSLKLAGYYGEVGKTYIESERRRQDVAEALKDLVSDKHAKSLKALPQSVLNSIQILANDSLITSASYRAEDTPKGPVYNMDLELTDEGRKRLWQYSKAHKNEQLLLVVDGVAVAAMRIGTELAQTRLTISGLPDERIVKDAVNKINAQSKNP